MSQNNCPTIAKANVQQLFFEIEDTTGVLQRPTAEGYILPRGQATLSQTPTYTNSEELSPSLNITAQFQDGVGAGEASISMYVRLEKDGRMEGHDLLHSFMGGYQERRIVTAAVNSPGSPDDLSGISAGGISGSVTEIPFDGVTGGFMPPRGIVQIDNEKIRYHDISKDGTTLINCVRGYGGTTAVEHDDDASITLVSAVYYQDVCRPSGSIWLRLDHTVLFASGCVVTQNSIPLTKTGGQQMDFTISFRRMGWCGTGHLAGIPSGGVISLNEEEANAFTEGALIQNKTRKDNNNNAGYTITAVDVAANTITVSPAPGDWAADDIIAPWLPTPTPIGEPVESKDARVFIDGKAGKLTEGSVTLGTPTSFASEIGDEYPGENADSSRALSMNTGLYFRSKDAVEFGKGYRGYELPVAVVLGNKATGSLSMYMPRVKFNTPTVSTADSFVTLTREGAIMGIRVDVEDALYFINE